MIILLNKSVTTQCAFCNQNLVFTGWTSDTHLWMCNALNVLPVRVCQINTVHWFAEKTLQNVNKFLQLEIMQRLSSLQKNALILRHLLIQKSSTFHIFPVLCSGSLYFLIWHFGRDTDQATSHTLGWLLTKHKIKKFFKPYDECWLSAELENFS